MKVLILGATGMLGHKAWQVFSGRCDTYVTMRQEFSKYENYGLFERSRTLDNIDAGRIELIEESIKKVKPEVVLNCIGIIKQSPVIGSPLEVIQINSLLPHQLAQICNNLNIRLIHISTDCVFSGEVGSYLENDPADADDFYGKTKFLGEPSYGRALTLRTSMIGREINSSHGLLEWFLSSENKKIKGYTKAMFSGFTTEALCEIILDVIMKHKNLSGLYHVSSLPIDKFSLLSLIKGIYGVNVEIEPDDGIRYDRSLNSERFRKVTNFKPCSWEEMVVDMYKDVAFYEALRRKNDF